MGLDYMRIYDAFADEVVLNTLEFLQHITQNSNFKVCIRQRHRFTIAIGKRDSLLPLNIRRPIKLYITVYKPICNLSLTSLA